MVELRALSSGLTQREDGIWYADSEQSISYPASGHVEMAQVEESSFWFNHRNTIVSEVITAFPPPPDTAVLDVGGGNGYVSLAMAKLGYDVILIEPGTAGAQQAHRRGIETVICATTTTAQIAAESVGGIGLFDVIEHIEDDQDFVSQMAELLVPGGRLYATVPAYRWLWSDADEQAGHWRRHTASSIQGLLETTDLEVDYVSYFFRPLPVPVLLTRSVPYRLRMALRRPRGLAGSHGQPTRSGNAHGVDRGILSRTMTKLLAREARMIQKQRPMRAGGSIIIAAHKSGGPT